MMQIANRDVFPTDTTTEVFAPVRTLFQIPAIDEAFNKHEAAAVRAKRRYHRFGRLAIILIAFSSIYTVAEAIIIPPYPAQPLTSAIAALLAGLGIVLQIYLITTHQKEKWLLNRYAVERLRSAKFQAYHLGHIANVRGRAVMSVDETSARVHFPSFERSVERPLLPRLLER